MFLEKWSSSSCDHNLQKVADFCKAVLQNQLNSGNSDSIRNDFIISQFHKIK